MFQGLYILVVITGNHGYNIAYLQPDPSSFHWLGKMTQYAAVHVGKHNDVTPLNVGFMQYRRKNNDLMCMSLHFEKKNSISLFTYIFDHSKDSNISDGQKQTSIILSITIT